MSIQDKIKEITKTADYNAAITSLHSRTLHKNPKIPETVDFVKQTELTVFENKFLLTINFAEKTDFFSQSTKLEAQTIN